MNKLNFLKILSIVIIISILLMNNFVYAEGGALRNKYMMIGGGDADVNNKITAADARKTLRASAGLETGNNFMDVDFDGKITSSDAREILRASSKTVKLDKYSVLKSACTVRDYVQTNKLTQKTSDYSGYGCWGYATCYAYAINTNNPQLIKNHVTQCHNNGRSYNDPREGFAATKFTYASNQKSELLSKIKSELTSGRACVLRVNANESGSERHYVTVIGAKTNILNSYNNLSETDLLILDVYDGKIEPMYGKNSNDLFKNERTRFIICNEHASEKMYEMYTVSKS